MSSLWTDLLFLRGHITDLKLLRRLAARPQPHPHPRDTVQARPAAGRSRLGWPFRFCLGIGDGRVRTQ